VQTAAAVSTEAAADLVSAADIAHPRHWMLQESLKQWRKNRDEMIAGVGSFQIKRN